MSRPAAVLLIALVPGFAAAQSGAFQIVDAKVEKERMTWNETVLVPVTKTVFVEVEVNGKKVVETRTEIAYETQTRTVTVELKKAKATDAAGKEIAADRLAELLKEPAPVILTMGPIAEKHRALFKDKVIFVELPGPTPPK